eukprot:364788-Chlamydomonas_euryale.AAC.6
MESKVQQNNPPGLRALGSYYKGNRKLFATTAQFSTRAEMLEYGYDPRPKFLRRVLHPKGVACDAQPTGTAQSSVFQTTVRPPFRCAVHCCARLAACNADWDTHMERPA